MWGKGFGSWGHTDGNDNATKLDRSTGGFFVGADTALFDNRRVGVLGGYSRSTFDVDVRNSLADSDEYHVGLYAGTQMGGIGFRAGATYTWHDVSMSRSLTFAGLDDQLTSDYNAGTTQVFGELGYEIGAGQFTVKPFANLAYVNLHTDRFVESGGVAALTGDSGDTDTTFSMLGVRPSIAFTLGDVATTIRGSLGWRHAFGDVSPIFVLSFADGNPFEISGVPIAKDAALVELGSDFNVASTVAGGVSYEGQFADGATDNSVRGTFSVKF